MTPPDSGKRCCDLADRGHRAGCPGKPDSGEREVLRGDEVWRRGFREGWACARDDAASSHPAGFAEPPLDYPYIGANSIPRELAPASLIPLSLAQRILAALEGNGNAALRIALADELRAIVERKT